MTVTRLIKDASGEVAVRLHTSNICIIEMVSMVVLPVLWQVVCRIGDASVDLLGDPEQRRPIGIRLSFHVLIATELPRVYR